MELLSKLEHTLLGWLKEVPHLPRDVRKWLGDNLWWIVAIVAVGTAIAVFSLVLAVLNNLSMLGSPVATYYASATFVAFESVKTSVSLIFTALGCILLALAVAPLREKHKKGWMLLFAAWIVSAVAVVIGAIITLNPFAFFTNIIFGALWLIIELYFIFEVHGQFTHIERSKGVKKNA